MEADMALRNRTLELTGTEATAATGMAPAAPAATAGEWSEPSARDGIGVAALGYATYLLLFLGGPPLLASPSAVYPLLRVGEILDLVAPVAVIPFAWLLVRRVSPVSITPRQTMAFLLLAALWVEGHSLHLAANAIRNHPLAGAEAVELAYFLDEQLGHWILHFAILGLSGFVAWRSLRAPAVDGASTSWSIAAAAAVYGFAFFLAVVEGQTAFFAVPAMLLITLGAWWAMRRRGALAAGAVFVAYGYAATLVLLVVWAALNDWRLVEFSDLGLI
jgi:hypothetical protein